MYGDYGQVSPLDVMNWHISASFSSVQAKLLPSETVEVAASSEDL